MTEVSTHQTLIAMNKNYFKNMVKNLPSTTFPDSSAVPAGAKLAMYAPISPLVPGIAFPPTTRTPKPPPENKGC